MEKSSIEVFPKVMVGPANKRVTDGPERLMEEDIDPRAMVTRNITLGGIAPPRRAPWDLRASGIIAQSGGSER